MKKILPILVIFCAMNAWAVHGPPPPPTPYSLSFYISWADTNTAESGFRLYGRMSSATTFALLQEIAIPDTGDFIYTTTGFEGDTFECYVTAFDGAGESLPSNIASVVIPAEGAPPPSSLSAPLNTSVSIL